MPDFAIRVEGLAPAEKRLYDLSVKFGDLLPLMETLGELLENSAKHRFETETSADGTPWKQSIRAKEDGGKTLTVDGHLRDSITHLATPRSTEIGSNLIYARPNFLGAVIKPVNAEALVFNLPGIGIVHAQQVIIPARNPLGVSDTDMVAIDRQISRYAETLQ